MLFTELRFLVFFAVVFGLYWAMSRNSARKLLLLTASYLFYAAWDWRFLSLILISTLIDFGAGLAMRGRPRPARRPWLLLSLTTNLGILTVFKYYDFFVESAVEFSAWLGLPLPRHSLKLILPLGISFYTFQTLSYSIDVFRGRMQPTRSLLDFALFVAFFPQLVAGPIVRAEGFLPQLVTERSFHNVAFRSHLLLFLIGFVKKACIADRLAEPVDLIFSNPSVFGAANLWLGSLMYTLQIYCDFSGYSDMAIACAGMLGYRLVDNFNYPYLARSIRDFWRRWHMSLSSWFRDYLYIPLGGSRVSPGREAANLFIVFTLCGLWHGANSVFVVWGLYHGAFLALERVVKLPRMPRLMGHLYTLVVVNLGFVIFRSLDMPAALGMLGDMLDPRMWVSDPWRGAIDPIWGLVLVGTGLALHLPPARASLERCATRLPDWGYALAYGVTVALVFPWVATEYTPFIYFQF